MIQPWVNCMLELRWTTDMEAEMSPTLQEISAQARLLPASERAVLAEQLLADLDADAVPEADLQRIWADEVRARIQADRTNELPSITHEELMAKLRRA